MPRFSVCKARHVLCVERGGNGHASGCQPGARGQALRLGSNIVLAWLLFPEAFGLMLLVNVFMQGLQMFSDIGIGPSIIQNKRGNDPDFLNTAWTIQAIRGFVLWFIACVLAWPIAWIFAHNDPLAWKLVLLIPVAMGALGSKAC
jgi:O-antigen/teichoic acid export membrane protein